MLSYPESTAFIVQSARSIHKPIKADDHSKSPTSRDSYDNNSIPRPSPLLNDSHLKLSTQHQDGISPRVLAPLVYLNPWTPPNF